MKNKGFTLIEILIVMAVMLIIASASYVAFIKFNKQQRMNVAYENVRDALNDTRASALSQTINSCLMDQTLDGYRVDFAASSYTISEICKTDTGSIKVYPKPSRSVPSDVTLTANPASFLFAVLTGEFINSGLAGTISLTNGSGTRIITVYPSGRIQ